MRILVIVLVIGFILNQTAKADDKEMFSFDTISGSLPFRVLNTGMPYLVIGDITVPPGENVIVEPGVIFMFKNFTGLQVHGTLMAEGTKNRPIIFTSENDKAYFPLSPMDAAPYDWNGITVHESGSGTRLENCSVLYSLFGINSLTEYVTIRSCIFSQNGKSDLTIGGTPVTIEKQPFTYTYLTDDSEVKKQIAAEFYDPVIRRRSMLRYTGISLLVGGCALGIWKTLDYRNSSAEFEKLNDFHKNAQQKDVDDKWEAARKQRNADLGMLLGGFATALVGGAAVTISFYW